MNLCPLTDDGRMERPSRRRMKIEQSTRWFKYDRDWFVCKQAALRSSCATLREWSHNLHPPSLLLGLEPVQSCLGVARVMSEQKVPRSVKQLIVIKFLVGENVPSAEIHHRLQQQYGEGCLLRSKREGGGCGFTLSRSHSCCAVRLVYTQISPGHIWTTLYIFNWFVIYNRGGECLLRSTHCVVIYSILRFFFKLLFRL